MGVLRELLRELLWELFRLRLGVLGGWRPADGCPMGTMGIHAGIQVSHGQCRTGWFIGCPVHRSVHRCLLGVLYIVLHIGRLDIAGSSVSSDFSGSQRHESMATRGVIQDNRGNG